MVKGRKKYIPGLAQLNFRPDEDWEIDEAREIYEEASFPISFDDIIYSDCISGMEKLPDSCIDLIIADPPFGIEFDGLNIPIEGGFDLAPDGPQFFSDVVGLTAVRFFQSIAQILPRN